MQLRHVRSSLGSVKLRAAILRCNRKSCRVTSVRAASGSSSMEPSLTDLVQHIHSTDHKVVVYATGRASQALGWLLCVPGASNTVLEMTVPYARDSLVSILGKEPEQYCSEDTAAMMAKAAYQRAAVLTEFGTPIIGLGATCALATEPPKRGPHRLHICSHDGIITRVVSATLAKGARTRLEEDGVASRLLIKVLAEQSGVGAEGLNLQLLTDGQPEAQDIITESSIRQEDPLAELLAGKVRCVEFSGGRVYVDAPRHNKLVLPGSFNPLHIGHRELLAAALKSLGPGVEGYFELSVGNADKGMLALAEVKRRIQQFVDLGLPVVATCRPLFVQKAELLPGTKFVVGWDTAIRLLMPKYHGGSMQALLQEFQQLRAAGCRFIVAGRKDKMTNEFRTFADVEVPAELADLFTGLTEDDFRIDISSTELRAVAAPLPPTVPGTPELLSRRGTAESIPSSAESRPSSSS